MSAVPSTPSTPGTASASRMRSSSSVREAMAWSREPTPRAPRAGWSAAMIIIVPSVSATVRRERVAARRANRPGSSIRTRVTSS